MDEGYIDIDNLVDSITKDFFYPPNAPQIPVDFFEWDKIFSELHGGQVKPIEVPKKRKLLTLIDDSDIGEFGL